MARNGIPIAIASISLALFLIGFAAYTFWSDMRNDKVLAPDFEIQSGGNVTRLRELSGAPLLLHFTSIENPLCIECEKELKGQVHEISKAVTEDENLIIITINMRKNRYSDPGHDLVREWWGVNVTWIWIEDIDPFPISGRYVDHWSIGSEAANPTILLLDEEQYIVGTYHIYQMGKGEVDGILTSEEMVEKTSRIRSGQWEGVEGGKSSIGTGSLLGMFVLGIVTSLSPCSIALLFTVFTFIVSSNRSESGGSERSQVKGLAIGLTFMAGMAGVFFLLGLLIAQVGVFVQNARYFDLIAGSVLVLLGLNNLFDLTEKIGNIKDRFSRMGPGHGPSGSGFKGGAILWIKGIFERSPLIGALLLGIFFSLGWAPCAVSLVLPVVVWILSQDVSALTSGSLFLVFGIGHGLLFIPLAVGSTAFAGSLTHRFVSIGKWVKMVFGAIVISMGLIFMARLFGFGFW